MLSISRVSGPLSFRADVATFQIVPSGAWTTPPYPHRDFVTGLRGVAPHVEGRADECLDVGLTGTP